MFITATPKNNDNKIKVNHITAAGWFGTGVYGQGSKVRHLTLHQCVEGVNGRQVGGDGDVLVSPRRLDVHGYGARRHVAVQVRHHAGGKGHVGQAALAVIAGWTMRMQIKNVENQLH